MCPAGSPALVVGSEAISPTPPTGSGGQGCLSCVPIPDNALRVSEMLSLPIPEEPDPPGRGTRDPSRGRYATAKGVSATAKGGKRDRSRSERDRRGG